MVYLENKFNEKMDEKFLFCVSVLSGGNVLYGPEWKEMEKDKSLLDMFLQVCGTKIIGQQVQVLVSKEKSFIEAALVQVCSSLKQLVKKKQNYIQFVLKEDTVITQKSVFPLYNQDSSTTKTYPKLNVLHGSQQHIDTIHDNSTAAFKSWSNSLPPNQQDITHDFFRDEKPTPLHNLTSRASFENMSVEEICEEIRKIKSAEVSKNKLSTWVEETKKKQVVETIKPVNFTIGEDDSNDQDLDTSNDEKSKSYAQLTESAKNKLNNSKTSSQSSTKTPPKNHISERLARLAEPRRRSCPLTKVNNLQAEKQQLKTNSKTNSSKTITPRKTTTTTRKSSTETPSRNKIAATKRASCSPSMTRGSSVNSTFIKTGVKITQSPKGNYKARGETKSTEYFVEIFTKEKSVKGKQKTNAPTKKKSDFSTDSLMNVSTDKTTSSDSSIEKSNGSSIEGMSGDTSENLVSMTSSSEVDVSSSEQSSSGKLHLSMSEMLLQVHNDVLNCSTDLSADNDVADEIVVDKTVHEPELSENLITQKNDNVNAMKERLDDNGKIEELIQDPLEASTSPFCHKDTKMDQHEKQGSVITENDQLISHNQCNTPMKIESKNINTTIMNSSEITPNEKMNEKQQQAKSNESSPEEIIFDKSNLEKELINDHDNVEKHQKNEKIDQISKELLYDTSSSLSIENLLLNNFSQEDQVEKSMVELIDTKSTSTPLPPKDKQTNKNTEDDENIQQNGALEVNHKISMDSKSFDSLEESNRDILHSSSVVKENKESCTDSSDGISTDISSEDTAALQKETTIKNHADLLSWSNTIGITSQCEQSPSTENNELNRTFVVADKNESNHLLPVQSSEKTLTIPSSKDIAVKGLVLPVKPTKETFSTNNMHQKTPTGKITTSPDKNRKKWGNTIEGMDNMLIPSLEAFSQELRNTAENTASKMRVLYEDWQVKYEGIDPSAIKSTKIIDVTNKTSPKDKNIAGGEQQGIAAVFRNLRKMEVKLKTMEQAVSAMVKAMEDTSQHTEKTATASKKASLSRAKSFKWSELKTSVRNQTRTKEWMKNRHVKNHTSEASSDSD